MVNLEHLSTKNYGVCPGAETVSAPRPASGGRRPFCNSRLPQFRLRSLPRPGRAGGRRVIYQITCHRTPTNWKIPVRAGADDPRQLAEVGTIFIKRVSATGRWPRRFQHRGRCRSFQPGHTAGHPLAALCPGVPNRDIQVARWPFFRPNEDYYCFNPVRACRRLSSSCWFHSCHLIVSYR